MLQPVTKGENKNRIIKYTNPKECIPVGGGEWNRNKHNKSNQQIKDLEPTTAMIILNDIDYQYTVIVTMDRKARPNYSLLPKCPLKYQMQ